MPCESRALLIVNMSRFTIRTSNTTEIEANKIAFMMMRKSIFLCVFQDVTTFTTARSFPASYDPNCRPSVTRQSEVTTLSTKSESSPIEYICVLKILILTIILLPTSIVSRWKLYELSPRRDSCTVGFLFIVFIIVRLCRSSLGSTVASYRKVGRLATARRKKATSCEIAIALSSP